MALYSWFSRNDTKPSVKTVSVNNGLLNASNTVKYIENYTMWPTAKIKANAEIIPPKFGENLAKSQKVIISTETTLTVIKS